MAMYDCTDPACELPAARSLPGCTAHSGCSERQLLPTILHHPDHLLNGGAAGSLGQARGQAGNHGLDLQGNQ